MIVQGQTRGCGSNLATAARVPSPPVQPCATARRLFLAEKPYLMLVASGGGIYGHSTGGAGVP